MSAEGFTPIGVDAEHVFSGHYNGNNHSVSNLHLAPTNTFSGMFGYMSGTVYYLTLKNEVISSGNAVGGLVGNLSGGGIIRNCAVDNISISGTHTFAGGICGSVSGGRITSVTVSGIVRGDCAGGICAWAQNNAELWGMTNSAQVSSTADYAGGIVGTVISSDLSACNNLGTVSCSNLAGGIAAMSDKTTISYCDNRGSVTSSNDGAGGIAGYFTDGEIDTCNNYAAVSAKTNAGGIASYVKRVYAATDILRCKNKGRVSSSGSSISSYSGGICAVLYTANVQNCWNDGEVYSIGNPGGIVGQTFEYATVSNCENSQRITSGNSYPYMGGIIANASSVIVYDCLNIGSVGSSGYYGAIAGYVYDAMFSNCYYLQGSASKGFGSSSGNYANTLTSSQLRDGIINMTLYSRSGPEGRDGWSVSPFTNNGYVVPGGTFINHIMGLTINTDYAQKLAYNVGDTFNKGGIVVTALLKDGTSVNASSACTFTNTTFNQPGKQMVKANVDGFSAEFEVKVLGVSQPVLNGDAVSCKYILLDYSGSRYYALAAYDANGKMLGVDYQAVLPDGEEHSLTVSGVQNAASYKLLKLNSIYAPN